MKVKLKYLILLFLLSIGLVYAVSQTMTVTSVNPSVNLTNYTTNELVLNVSTSNAASKCVALIGYNNGTADESWLMTNGTSNTTWVNASTFNPNSDSHFNDYLNLTYRCENGTAGIYWNSSVWYFGFDSTSPVIDGETYSYSNTTDGNQIVFTFNVTDNNTDNCAVRIINPTGSVEKTVDGTMLERAEDARCNVTLSPSDFLYNGNYSLEAWAEDEQDNTGVTTSNESIMIYKMKTGWNLITIYENKTLAEIASMVENISYVSSWDNLAKSYTTFTVGSSTNGAHTANATNATYVYANEDLTLMRDYDPVDSKWQNVTLYKTSTSGWNQMGVMNRMTLNNTLYNSTGSIFKYDGTHDTAYTSANITYVSYYNTTLGKYCSARRGFTATSCSPDLNVTDITLDRGQALWVLIDANITYDRGAG